MRFARPAVALTLVASSAAVIPATSAGAWNSTDIAIGSHPVANSGFYQTHDVDSSGNTVTVFQIHSPNGSEVTDVDPGSGTTELISTGYFDAVITKFDSSGVLQWTYQIKGGNSTFSEVNPRAIKTDSSGNIYVIGNFENAVDFDGSASGTSGNLVTAPLSAQDGFLLKLGPSGTFEWVVRTFDTGAYDLDLSYNALDVDADGNVYVTGEHFAPIDLNYNGVSRTDDLVLANGGGFVAKFSSSGSITWVYEVGTSVGDIDVSGSRVVAAGSFTSGPIDFDPTSSNADLTAGGFFDLFIVELDTSGIYQRVQHVKGGTFGDQLTSPHVRMTSDGSVVLSGYFFGVIAPAGSGVNFSPPNASAFKAHVGAHQSGNGFVAKYSSTFAFQWASMFVPATPFASSPQQRTDIYALDVTSDGGAVIGGVYNGKVDLDPSSGVDARTSAPPSPAMDAFVMKIDSSGNREWIQVLTNNSAKLINSIVVRSGYVTTYGSFGGTLDFDPSSATYNVTANGTSAFIWRVDGTGTSAPAVLPTQGQNNNSNTGSNTSGSGGSNTNSSSGTSQSTSTTSTLTDAQIAAFKAAALVQGSQVIAGQSYTVTADGFSASETVSGYLKGSSSSIGSSSANTVGKASVSIKIPSNASGKKTLYLHGARSGHGVRQTITINKAASVLPATGNNPQLMWWAVAVLTTGIGILAVTRRRRFL